MNQFRDPFNPKTGEFVNNIRVDVGGDDDELRQSLKQLGWRKEFPALVDERGVTLVGHRRLRLAKELGIAPVTETLRFGIGDAADAERLKVAIASNVGGKPMTRDDRKRIADYLYSEREWTMQRIADALNVTTMTISRDLEEAKPPQAKSGVQTQDGVFNTMLKTPSRPRSSGRPQGSKKSKKKRQRTTTPKADSGLTGERDYRLSVWISEKDRKAFQSAAEAQGKSAQLLVEEYIIESITPANIPSAKEVRQRDRELAGGAAKLKGLTREQVDPDFKGTAKQWVEEYGKVNLRTKVQIEQERFENCLEALLAWLDRCQTDMISMYLRGWIDEGKPPKFRLDKLAKHKEKLSVLHSQIAALLAQAESSETGRPVAVAQ